MKLAIANERQCKDNCLSKGDYIGEIGNSTHSLRVTVSQAGSIDFYYFNRNGESAWAGLTVPMQVGIMIAEKVGSKHLDPRYLKEDFGISVIDEEMAEEEQLEENGGIIIARS